MRSDQVFLAIFALAVSLATGYVNIPDGLKTSRLMRYSACRDLVNQNQSTFMVDKESLGSFNKVCNCTFYRKHGSSGLSIECKITRDIVIPISVRNFDFFRQIIYYIVKYRLNGAVDWKEKRVEISENPEFRIELDRGKTGKANVYDVEVYAVLPYGEERLIFSDDISSLTGKTISTEPIYRPGLSTTETEYTQYSHSYRMDFDEITDTSMKVSFQTESPTSFRAVYIRDGREVELNFDGNDQASLTGLNPGTGYVFIVYADRNGRWNEMRRKTVFTLNSRPGFETFTPSVIEPIRTSRDITLQCPVSDEINLQTLSWYKGADTNTARLLATYDALSGITTYPSDRDPKISVIDGTTLKISQATPEAAGHYKCRFSIIGAGTTWSSVTPRYVTLYIIWTSRYINTIDAYLIQYRPSDQISNWQTLTNTGSTSALIRGLEPETRYEFEIYDYSDGRKGALVDKLTKTTSATDDREPIIFPEREPAVDPCEDLPCGSGVCRPSPEPHCECENGYTGFYCDIAVDTCRSDPCQNGGECVTIPTGYSCRCATGYTGLNCDREIDPCYRSPCFQGTCERQARGYSCSCYSGFTGRDCDQRIDNCASGPCFQGTCIDSSYGYTCRCYAGYEGKNCERLSLPVDPCSSEPCVHGTCVSRGSSYRCRCDAGYTGRDCNQVAVVRDFCSPNPCRNAGLCNSVSGNYVCRCRRGFKGRNCETKLQLNYCEVRPCVHGRCRNLRKTYSCICDDRYSGRNCDVEEIPGPYIVLRCPVNSRSSDAHAIFWSYIGDQGAEQIYTYNIRGYDGREGPSRRFYGRASSPTASKLRLDNITPEDIGVFQCKVQYHDRTEPSPYMRLFQVPEDEDSISFRWRAPRIYIDHYDVRYRDASTDGYFIQIEIPGGSSSYTLRNLQPGHVYEIYVTPYTTSGQDNRPVTLNFLPRNTPTSAPVSRADNAGSVQPVERDEVEEEEATEEDFNDSLEVRVIGPANPVGTGQDVTLSCQYPIYPSEKPYIKWKKWVGSQDVFLYNQKMPIVPNENRITMTDEHTLTIQDFTPNDAATYECTVTYKIGGSSKFGSGRVIVRSREEKTLAIPTDFRSQVIGDTTTSISWRQPQPLGITGYILRYYPVTALFGEYEEREVSTRSATLRNLVRGTVYRVEIRATNGRDYSEPLTGSFEQMIEVVPPPTDMQASMVSKTQARVTWTPPDDTGITGYKIQFWDISKPAPNNLQERTVSGPEVILSPLEDGKVYQVWVQARKNNRLSQPLASQIRKTTPSTPNPPQNVNFQDVESDSVTIHWEAPQGWRTTDKYRVKYESLDENYPQSETFPDSAPQTLTVNNLRPGIVYLFTVYSVRDNTPSEPVYKKIKTTENIFLSAPYPESLTIQCKANYSGDLEPYRTRWYKVDSAGREKLIFTSTSTTTRTQFIPNPTAKEFAGRLESDELDSLTILDVRYPGDFGKYKCTMKSRLGTYDDFIELVARYPENIAPPTHFTFELLNDTTAIVRWRHPYPDDVTSFYLRYWPTVRRYGNEYDIETKDVQAILTRLVKGTEYQVVIKAKIGNRESDDSLVGQFINFSDKVTDVEVERIDRNELLIRWKNPPLIDGIMFSFRRDESRPWNDQPPQAPHVESRRIRMPMAPGETVYFKLTTLKNNIPTPLLFHYSEPDDVTEEEVPPQPVILLPNPISPTNAPPGGVYPSPPSNLVLTSPSDTSIRATWSPTPEVYFDHYRVDVKNLITQEYEEFTVPDSFHLITGLKPNDKYEVSVRTVNRGFDSYPISDIITLGAPGTTVRTPSVASSVEPIPDYNEPAPLEREGVSSSVPPPEDLQFPFVTRSRFTARWVSPADDITDFEVSHRRSGTGEDYVTEIVRDREYYTFRNLRPNTLYEVKVVSLLDNLKSFPTVGTKRTQAPVPRRVILQKPNARVVNKTSTSFVVMWVPQNAEHSLTVLPIGGSGRPLKTTVPKGVSSYEVTGLQPRTRHRVKITATADGRRGIEKTLYVTTNPEKPSNLRVTSSDATTMSLIWDDDSTLTIGYRVNYMPTSTNEMTSVDVVDNRITLDNLLPDTEYRVLVQTKHGNDLSKPASITERTKPDTLDAPERMESVVGQDDAVVTWSPVSRGDYYEVSIHPEDNESVVSRFTSTDNNFTIPNVFPGQYVIEVKGVNSGVPGPAKEINFEMPVKEPTNLRLSDVTSSGLRASWDAPLTRLYTPKYDVIALPNSIHAPLMLPSEKRTTETTYDFSRLRPNTEYKVQVVSRYGELKSEPVSAVVTTVDVPQPQDVDAVVSNGVVRVTWSPVYDVDEYELTFAPIGDEGSNVTVPLSYDTTFYEITDLPPGDYEITVTAVKEGVRSPAAQVQSAIQAVAPPSNIKFSDITEESFIVEWMPPRTRQRFEYEIKVLPVNDRTNPIQVNISEESWKLIEGLEPETQYIVEVSSVFGEQTSEPVRSYVTTAQLDSPRRADVTVTEGVVQLEWTPVEDVDHYEVQYYPIGEEESVVTREVTTTYFDIPDLAPGDYEITVTAVKGGHRSPATSISHTVDVPKPDGIIVVSRDEEPMEIVWEAVPNAESYEIFYTSPDGSPVLLVVDGTRNSIVLEDLEPETEYSIDVSTIINDEHSAPTTLRITTPPDSTPSGYEPVPIEEGIRINWNTEETEPEYEVKYYTVVRDGDEEEYGPPNFQTVPSDEHGLVLRNLLPGKEYVIEVIAIESEGPQRKPIKFTVTTPLDKPGNVVIGEPGAEEVTVDWEPSRGEVTEYVIEFIPSDGSKVIRYPVNPDVHTVTASGLRPNTEYEVRIVARNDDQEIESQPLVQRIRTEPKITRPQNLRILPETDGSLTLLWDEPLNPVQYYRVIYRKTSGFPRQEEYPAESGTNETTLPQLVPNSEYEITVQGIADEVKEPSEDDSVTRRIKTVVPALPDAITFPDVTDTTVIVQWEVPAQERYLTGYRAQIFEGDSEVPTDVIDVSRSSNTVTFTALKPDTRYRVTVTPHIDEVPGSSASETVTTEPLREIPRPEEVHVSETTSEDIVIQWYPSENYEYITEFEIHVRDQDGNTVTTDTIPGDLYTYTVTDLEPATSYEITITSSSDNRKSTPETITAATRPSIPQTVTQSNVLSNQFEISWLPVEGDDVSYLINVVPVDNPSAEERFFETFDTSLLVPDVEPDTLYSVEVIALSQGLESNPRVIRLTTGSLPEVSQDEEVLPEEAFTVVTEEPEMVINWDRDTSAPITSYQILYKPRGTTEPEIITVPGNTGETVLSQLEPNTLYQIWVRGLLDTGEIIPIPISGKETVTDTPAESFQPLTEAPVFAPEDGKITVTWESLGPSITQYGITYANLHEEKEQIVVPGDYSSTIISGLVPGEQYVINVIGLNNESEPVLVSNANVGKAPYVPDEISASASSPNGQITIQWVSDLEDDEFDKVIGYQIIFDRKCCIGEPEIAWVPDKDSDTATIGILEPNTEYVFRVNALRSDGVSTPVSSVEIRDEVDFPETKLSEWLTPPTITDFDGEGFTTTIHWKPPEEVTRPITHYTITYVPVNNRHAPSLKVTVPESQTSHTMTGLSQNTEYNIEIQSVNLPTKTSSTPVTESYLTPINTPMTPDRPGVFPEEEEEDEYVVIPTIRVVPSRRPSAEPTPEPHSQATRSFPTPTRIPIWRPLLPEKDADEIEIQPPIHLIPSPRPRPEATRPPEPHSLGTRTFPTPTRVPPSTIPPRTTVTTGLPEPLVNVPSETTPTGDDTSVGFITETGQISFEIPEGSFPEEDMVVTYWRDDEPYNKNYIELPATTPAFTITSLEPNTPYHVIITPETETYGDVIRPVMVTDDEMPRTLHPYQWILKPTIENVTRLPDGSVVIQWYNPHPQPREVTHHVLRFSPKGTERDLSDDVKIVINAPATSHTVTGLNPNTDYTIILQSVNKPTGTRSVSDKYVFDTDDSDLIEERPPRTTTTTRPWQPRTRSTTSSPNVVSSSFVGVLYPITPTPGSRRPAPIHPVRTTKRTPTFLTERSTMSPQPILEGDEEGPEETGGSETEEEEEEEHGVDALPTVNGNVIINWTPSQTPVDNYVIELRPSDGVTPARNITVPGDKSWVNIPEVLRGQGYTITIYTEKYGEKPRVLYNIRLDRTQDRRDGFNLVYQPVITAPGRTGSTNTIVTETQQVYIPAGRPEGQLPDDHYSFQLPDQEEYTNWVRPIVISDKRVEGADSVTLRWQPEKIETTTSRRNRLRLQLVPQNNPNAENITRLVSVDRNYTIRGLQPGVAYRLYAEYLRNDGVHRAGDLAANFLVPAFTRHGRPVTQQTFGISEVWMRELKTGELLLQWEPYYGATGYYVEYRVGSEGEFIRKNLPPNERWVVLPRLEPGQTYTINIYAIIEGRSTQVYTVTVRRKIIGPAPPSKVEWYNMFGHSVDLSWSPPRGPVTGYRLTYVLEGEQDPITYDLPANMTTFHLDNLIPGKTYIISIVTLRGEETSRPLSFRLHMVVPTVRKIYFQQTSPNEIVVRWPALPDYVNGYLVNVRTVSPAGPDLVPDTLLSPDQTSYTITGIRPGVRYEFTIRTRVRDQLSEKVVLHLWTLLAESRLSRIEESGTWTVSWHGNPYEVDHWSLIVTPLGEQNPVVVEDNIDRFTSSFQIPNLTPGVTYTVSIYGVKNDVRSSPIQIRIPAYPASSISRTEQISTRTKKAFASGKRMLRNINIRRKSDEIQLNLIPMPGLNGISYVVEYKKSTDTEYTTENVVIHYGNPTTVVISGLERDAYYNVNVTTQRGLESSQMHLNIDPPKRRVQKPRLPPLRGIQRNIYSSRDSGTFELYWQKPRAEVSHYTVTYDYTQLEGVETVDVTEPSIHVPNLETGHSAKFTFSYTTLDGRESPKSTLTMSVRPRNTRSVRNLVRTQEYRDASRIGHR